MIVTSSTDWAFLIIEIYLDGKPFVGFCPTEVDTKSGICKYLKETPISAITKNDDGKSYKKYEFKADKIEFEINDPTALANFKIDQKTDSTLILKGE